MSSGAASPEVQIESPALHVLTITPFFPSVQEPSQGCFIAEPIERIQQFHVTTRTIAVSPFYRRAVDPCIRESEWAKYYCAPGNLGLATSGAGVLRAIRTRARELHHASHLRLIHAHAALPCGEAAMALAGELGIPFIISVHGLDVCAERQAGRWLGRWTKHRSLRVYQQAKHIVCISRKVRQLLPAEFHRKAQVIYNGVDTDLFSPKAEENSRLRILSVGNLIPTKGHTILLKAFARVLKAVPDVELEIIGEGPERASLAGLATSLGISGHVAFHGRLSRPQVASAMRSCAVFVLPSHYEGLGCVYLEAMACGKPAVACTGQGIDEIIRTGENGVLIPPRDEVALADALLSLVQDAAFRGRLGIAARQTVARRHTLERQAYELAALYRECAR